MNIEKLKELLGRKEGLKFDFKRQLNMVDSSDKSMKAKFQDEFVRDVLALVNGNIGTAGETAFLIVGVEDKLKSDGTRDLYDCSHITLTPKEILQKVNACCNPPIPDIQCKFIEMDSKQLFIVSIPPTPYLHETTRDLMLPNGTRYPKSTVFIRRGEEIHQATINEIDEIRKEKQLAMDCAKANGVMSLEEGNYLEAVKQKYQDWWEDSYSFMNEINNAPWQELELTVKVPKSKLNNETNSLSASDDDKTAILPILDALSQVSSERVLIVGKAGAGKSTILAKVLLEAAKEALQNPNSPIPLLIKLKDYQNQSDFLLLIRDAFEGFEFLEEMQESEQITYIKRLIKYKRLVLLADGVNELSSDGYRAFKYFCGDHLPMIATTRDINVGNLGIQTKLEIQPLSSEKVKDFFSEKLPDHHGNSRVQELCDRVRDFGQTPLMVWMLYIIFKQNPLKETPNTRGEAYQEFTDIYSREAKDEVDWVVLTEMRSQLSLLAFEMTRSEKPFNEGDVLTLIGREKIRKNLLSNHLLQCNGTAGSRKVQFCHPSLQEYYAAEYILAKLPELIEKKEDQKYTPFQMDYLNYLKWTEAIAIMLGFPDINDLVEQVVQQALDVDLFLGARLSGEAKAEIQETTVKLVENINTTDLVKITLLEKTESIQSVDGFKTLLSHQNENVRRRAAWALRKMPCDVIITLSEIALKDSAPKIRENIVWALGDSKNNIAIPILDRVLQNDSSVDVRLRAVFALQKFVNEEAILSLLKATENPERQIKRLAVETLKELDRQKVLNTLSKVLSSKDVSLKITVVKMLRELGGSEVIPLLNEARLDLDHYVHLESEHSLEFVRDQISLQIQKNIKSSRLNHEAIQKREAEQCISALKSNIPIQRGNAIQKLYTFLGRDALSKVIEALSDSDSWVQLSACNILDAKLIRQFPEEIEILSKAIPQLIKIIENENPSNKACAASALGQLGDKKACPSLLKAIRCEDSTTRRNVLEALIKLGCPEVKIELLKALKDPDFLVRSSAIIELGSIQDRESIPDLINLQKILMS
ncbi:hypothetical protein TUMEXPCC7403_00010 [Tumidithrix helvetica PCC 7403]|uniref:HEAT repeat domain-containing protein n=1 Tax=Tumidithrix helvetica TaxID=3457545 RepID=UPI003C8116AD